MDNELRQLFFDGNRRGAVWKVGRVRYESAEIWRGQDCEPQARALHDGIVGVIGEGPYIMGFSGGQRDVYVIQKTTTPFRIWDFAALLPTANGGEAHVSGRMQGAVLFKAIDELNKDAVMIFSTIELRDQTHGGPVEALTWEGMLEALDDAMRTDIRALIANAKHANRYGTPTPLQRSLLLFKEDLASHVSDLQTVGNLCVSLDSIITRYPNSFSTGLPAFEGWEYDHVGQIFRPVSISTYYQSLYMDKAAFFIGSNGAGKTALTLSLAKDFAIRKRKELVVSAKALDPLGIMTRAGDITRAGAFVFSDAPLRTLMHEILDDEAVKALLDVREACSLPARYHAAILPAKHARLFSANSGVRVDGSVDHGAYFMTYRQMGLAYMARRDAGALRNMSDSEKAICRRVVMFTPSSSDIGLVVSALVDASASAYTDELEVQNAYYATR